MLLGRRIASATATRSSASAAGAAPSRRTRGSGPVRSSTVDGVPGQLAAVDDRGRAPRGARSGTSSSVRGSGPPGRFALVAATAPTCVERRSRAGPVESGTRTPIVSGPSPVSQRKRRAGFGRTSVYGPGRSARAIAPARPRSSGTHSSSTSTSAATSAVGCVAVAALERGRAAGRRLSVRRRGEPVDGVGREDHRLARAQRGDRRVDRRSSPALDDAVAAGEVAA